MESEKRQRGGQGQGSDHRPDDIGGDSGRSPIDGPGDEQGLEVRPHGLKQFVDDFVEKPLSVIIKDVEEILKSHLHTLNVSVDKENGQYRQVTLTARFQIRR